MEEVFDLRTYKPEALVICRGVLPPDAEMRLWAAKAGYVACCDNAVEQADKAGLNVDAVVGDGDSISPRLAEKYRSVLHREKEQDDNDFTKTVRFLKAKGLTRLVALGVSGKREDHTLGNISLLAYYMSRGVTVVAPTADGVFVPCTGRAAFATVPGREVSVFSAGASHLHAEGLQYPLYDFKMLWQGTLNKATANVVRVSGEGCYLVYLANE